MLWSNNAIYLYSGLNYSYYFLKKWKVTHYSYFLLSEWLFAVVYKFTVQSLRHKWIISMMYLILTNNKSVSEVCHDFSKVHFFFFSSSRSPSKFSCIKRKSGFSWLNMDNHCHLRVLGYPRSWTEAVDITHNLEKIQTFQEQQLKAKWHTL